MNKQERDKILEDIILSDQAFWSEQMEVIKEALDKHTTEDEPKFDTLDDLFGDLPPRTDWQELRMAFTIWRCNLKGRIRNWLQQEDK